MVVEPEFVLVAVVSVCEPQASVDIAFAFVVLVPVSVVAAEGESFGRPKFHAFPNVDYFANSSSFVEVVGQEFVHSPIGALANHGLCSTLSIQGPHQNKNLEHAYNNASLGHSNVSDTSGPPIDATTNHPRKRGLHQCQDQRRHSSQVSLLPLEVRQIR